MLSKNRNLFRITRFLLLKLPWLFKFFAKFRAPKKRLLIIKADAIGDYILFRNFIEIVMESESFKDYRIDLLGNKLWQDIAVQYDSFYIGEFIFIKPDGLYESPLETFKLGRRLYKNNYETVLQPTFARTLITDGLAAFTAAKQIVGFEGDTERIAIKYKSRTDRFYTKRLNLPPNINFEFEKLRFFFEDLLKSPITINGPFIKVKKRKPAKGIVICPGAGVLKRSWEPEKFLELIKLILQHTKQPVYIAGGYGDIKAGDFLRTNLPPGSVNNVIGLTSLPQLIELIGNAALVIANETSVIHIAAATKTNAICILGGGHFGRFAPYTRLMKSKPLCLYEKMECYNCNWNCKFETKENESYPCISAVSVKNVWLSILPMLSTT